MQDKKDNDLAADKSGQKTNQGGINEESSSKIEHLIDAAEIVAGLVFGGMAIALDAAGFHILSLIFGFLAAVCGLAIAAHLLQKFGLKYVKTGFIVTLILMALLFCFLAIHKPPVEPKPHFTISLQIGDNADAKISLTNDFLFDRRVIKTGDLPNGKILINSFVNGCLVIPVHDGETNKIFNFIAENDSQVKVSDLQLIVGFPKNLQCGVDLSWHKIEESFIIPGEWKFDATNMQFFLAQSPVPLFPYDWWGLPSITNPCISEYDGSSFQGGLVELSVRSTGFETMLAANVIFVPAETNFSKPYIGLGQLQTNGTLLIPPPPPEMLK
jgi:hypothetical protein